MDGAEAPEPPEKFAESFAPRKRGGLRLTSHACEDAPPVNITTCLDLLGCERIDHGYHVLEDQRCFEVSRRGASSSPAAPLRQLSSTAGLTSLLTPSGGMVKEV